MWKNAFKIPVHPEVTEEQKLMLDSLAGKVKKRGMGDMAVLALESTRPLHNLGSQGVIFLSPMLNMVFSKEEVARYVKLLENPKAVTYLVGRLGSEPEKKA